MIKDEVRDLEAKRLFRHLTNHAPGGQDVRDEARVRDRAPQTARSEKTLVNEM